MPDTNPRGRYAFDHKKPPHEELERLRREGATPAELAEAYSVPTGVVKKWLRELARDPDFMYEPKQKTGAASKGRTEKGHVTFELPEGHHRSRRAPSAEYDQSSGISTREAMFYRITEEIRDARDPEKPRAALTLKKQFDKAETAERLARTAAAQYEGAVSGSRAETEHGKWRKNIDAAVALKAEIRQDIAEELYNYLTDLVKGARDPAKPEKAMSLEGQWRKIELARAEVQTIVDYPGISDELKAKWKLKGREAAVIEAAITRDFMEEVTGKR